MLNSYNTPFFQYFNCKNLCAIVLSSMFSFTAYNPHAFLKKAKGILQSPHVAYQIDGDDKQNRMQV